MKVRFCTDAARGNAHLSAALQMFFLLDCSGSMCGAGITAVNEIMRRTLRDLAREQEALGIAIEAHILSFNDSATWLCQTTAKEGRDVSTIEWQDIEASGGTNTAGAILDILPGLTPETLGPCAYRPVVILLSDGYSNDHCDTCMAIERLANRCKAIRIAIAANECDDRTLEDFASEGSICVRPGEGGIAKEDSRKLLFHVNDFQSMRYALHALSYASAISSHALMPEDVFNLSAGKTPSIFIQKGEGKAGECSWADA